MADEDLFLKDQHPASRRLAVLEDDGTSAWLCVTDYHNRKRRCPACGSEDLVKLGRKFEDVAYVPAESESSFFSLARRTQANLWVCLDCGFLGWFLRGEELERLRDQFD